VYIQEAHAANEWQMPDNVKEKIVVDQPATREERHAVAQRCCSALKYTMPTVVDEIDNRVDHAYAAWPERLFVVAADGKIAYVGDRGPWGYKPADVEAWLKEHVGPPRKAERKSE